MITESFLSVAKTLPALDRFLDELPKLEKARPGAEKASTNSDPGNDPALLVRTPRLDLSTGTIPAEKPKERHWIPP